MSERTSDGRVIDYVLDCDTCRQMYVFARPGERTVELNKHLGHKVDLFRQARL